MMVGEFLVYVLQQESQWNLISSKLVDNTDIQSGRLNFSAFPYNYPHLYYENAYHTTDNTCQKYIAIYDQKNHHFFAGGADDPAFRC